jgi:membrane protease YdiL (CAAX protease family)
MGSSVDFPYYKGTPVAISAKGWVLLMLSIACAFFIFSAIHSQQFPATLLAALFFMGLPLLALAVVSGRYWTALFRRVGGREIGLMVLFAILSMTVSLLAAIAVDAVGEDAANPAVVRMSSMTSSEFVLRLIPTLPQLLGEELLTILPFLALLWLTSRCMALGRKLSICLALLGSSLLFAMAHLPTYDWHWMQCLGVIGSARVVMTLAYIWTRNIWVSTGAHVLNDWTEFAFSFGLGHLPIGAD